MNRRGFLGSILAAAAAPAIVRAQSIMRVRPPTGFVESEGGVLTREWPEPEMKWSAPASDIETGDMIMWVGPGGQIYYYGAYSQRPVALRPAST